MLRSPTMVLVPALIPVERCVARRMLLALMLAGLTAGCGRRGDLELPEGYEGPPPPRVSRR
jgi:hypothetical protein